MTSAQQRLRRMEVFRWNIQNSLECSIPMRLQSSAPLPESDEESPTTDLFESASQVTATVHFPGIAASAPSPAENDNVPDPPSLNEEQ